MSQPFTFPPPPPPPPKPNPISQQPTAYNRGRGRGDSPRSQNGRGDFQNSRGRGSSQNRGSQNARGHSSHIGQNNTFNNHRSQHRDGNAGPTISNPSPKRSYASAFNTREQQRRQRQTLAGPAIPSFGIDIDALLLKKPADMPTTKSVPQRKTNILGLTPTAHDEERESDDEGEETRLANSSLEDGLQISYRGQTSTLRSPEDIAAWISERRKRFPTQAKAEAAKREAEEKRAKCESEKKARYQAAQLQRAERETARQERELVRLREKILQDQVRKARVIEKNKLDDPEAAAKVRAEKLRKKALNLAEKLREAESALLQAEKDTNAEDSNLEHLLAEIDRVARHAQEAVGDEQAHVPLIEPSLQASDAPNMDLADDDTSSSGISSDTEDESTGSTASGSDSDSGSEPEVLTSRRIAPERVQPPAKKPAAAAEEPTICRNFTKHGRCKYGKTCHYLHERPKKTKVLKTDERRKGLYQIMVEKEREEDEKKALRAIIALGDRSLLQDSGQGLPPST